MQLNRVFMAYELSMKLKKILSKYGVGNEWKIKLDGKSNE